MSNPTGGGWRLLYGMGAASALVALAGMLCDVIITAVPGWSVSTVPTSVVGWLEQLASNPMLGLRNLDLLNVVVSIVGLPMYVAVYGAHRRHGEGLAALALMMMVLGTAVFVSSNPALPMLDISREYAAVRTEAQRLALEGAARALLAEGAHGSLGSFSRRLPFEYRGPAHWRCHAEGRNVHSAHCSGRDRGINPTGDVYHLRDLCAVHHTSAHGRRVAGWTHDDGLERHGCEEAARPREHTERSCRVTRR